MKKKNYFYWFFFIEKYIIRRFFFLYTNICVWKYNVNWFLFCFVLLQQNWKVFMHSVYLFLCSCFSSRKYSSKVLKLICVTQVYYRAVHTENGTYRTIDFCKETHKKFKCNTEFRLHISLHDYILVIFMMRIQLINNKQDYSEECHIFVSTACNYWKFIFILFYFILCYFFENWGRISEEALHLDYYERIMVCQMCLV